MDAGTRPVSGEGVATMRNPRRCPKSRSRRASAARTASLLDSSARKRSFWYYEGLAKTFAERLGPETPLVIDLAATVNRLCAELNDLLPVLRSKTSGITKEVAGKVDGV